MVPSAASAGAGSAAAAKRLQCASAAGRAAAAAAAWVGARPRDSAASMVPATNTGACGGPAFGLPLVRAVHAAWGAAQALLGQCAGRNAHWADQRAGSHKRGSARSHPPPSCARSKLRFSARLGRSRAGPLGRYDRGAGCKQPCTSITRRHSAAARPSPLPGAGSWGCARAGLLRLGRPAGYAEGGGGNPLQQHWQPCLVAPPLPRTPCCLHRTSLSPPPPPPPPPPSHHRCQRQRCYSVNPAVNEQWQKAAKCSGVTGHKRSEASNSSQ